MADSKIIKVGGDKVGIYRLEQVIAEMATEFAELPDREVAAEMMARLERGNYFSPSCLDEYAEAFVREFRKALGQPHQSEEQQGIEVKILGPGCPRCDQLYERVIKVLTGLDLAAELEKVTDTEAIAASGVLVTPGLVINGKVVSTGRLPSEQQIKQWLEAV